MGWNVLIQENHTRRKFYVRVINVLGAVITAALALPAAAYLLIKPNSQDSGEFIEVADLNQLMPGKPEEVVYRRTRVDGWKRMEEKTTTWVVKTQDKTIAFAPSCTHLGCAYHWNDEIQSFLCPCHTSVFALDGSVVSGPAPRPLDRYVSKTAAGKLLISQKLERV
jgi:menaquinol-cytochrome c reductase iron-sulfur subunit